MKPKVTEPTIDISQYADNIYKQNGIYFSRTKSDVSYPEEGNRDYFEIEQQSFWFQHRNNCIAELVKKYGAHEIFFDIGGGNGYVSKGLQDAGIETVLVEPGIHGAMNATKRGLRTVICSTLEDAGFRKNTIPLIGAFDVVEHIENDKAFLEGLFSYLADEGLVFITVPAYRLLWSDEDKVAGHYRRYTLLSIEKSLKTAGFKIEYSTYLFSILPFPIFLLRSIPSLFGILNPRKNLEKHKAQHAGFSKPLNRITDKVWGMELASVCAGKRIPLGSSCLVVGRKVT